MVRGDQINYNNIQNSSLYRYNTWNSNTSGTLIVCAPSFTISVYAYSVAFRNATGTATVSYFNGTGDGSQSSHWTIVWSYTNYIKGSGNSRYYFSHNNSTGTYPAVTATAPEDIHFWKIDYNLQASGGQAYTQMELTIYTTGRYTAEQYNSICKDKPIYGINPDYWGMGGTYATPQACIAAQRCSAYRGSTIYADGTVQVCGHRSLPYITTT